VSFSAEISSFASISALNANRLVRAVIIDVAEELVDRSPVGDPNSWGSPPPKNYKPGHFKANWHHKQGSADSSIRDTVDVTGDVSMNQIRSSVLNASKPADIHFLYNNVPYAMALENGHSDQAPDGMVALTVLDFPGIVDRAASRLKI